MAVECLDDATSTWLTTGRMDSAAVEHVVLHKNVSQLYTLVREEGDRDERKRKSKNVTLEVHLNIRSSQLPQICHHITEQLLLVYEPYQRARGVLENISEA